MTLFTKIFIVWIIGMVVLVIINKLVGDRNAKLDEQSEQLLASLQRLEDEGK